MRRRHFVAGMLLSLAAPLGAEAQPARKPARIGFISNSGKEAGTALVDAFRQGLRELGWIEGQNIFIDYRWAEGDLGRHPGLVAELITLKVEVIVLAGRAAAQAAMQGTRTIPIVVTAIGDPDDSGLVTSLAKPGRNLTGLAWQASDLVTKQLQLLQEIAPTAKRYVALGHPGTRAPRDAVEVAARSLGLKLTVVDVSAPPRIPDAFETAQRGRAEALVVMPSPMFYAHRQRLADLAARHRLPAIYEVKEYVRDGGLMSYGPSFVDMYHRAATYVDKILKGATPNDMPMEQPTKFELVINLKTAKALGLTIPPSLLLRADQVIE